MEDVLEVYTRPYDERFPQVCFDEKSKQLLAEVREPLAACPRRAARQDYEYERNGTANLFIISEPLVGWRHISVTERRTKTDWAHCIKDLVDIYYPHAERIVLVMDNLNTHTPAALYAGDSLHPEAWFVAEHGRDRALGACPSVSGSAYPRPGESGRGSRCVGSRA
jgi:hypothetical protein